MADFQPPLFSKRSSSTLSKKSLVSNGSNGYEDVFGGPPKFSVPTFAARIEDYDEIFGSFGPTSKKISASTIPYLDFPAEGEDEAPFEIRRNSRSFDYAQVFGFLDAGDFAVSYEEMLQEAKQKEMASENSRMPDGVVSQLQASTADSQFSAEEHYVDAFCSVEQNEFSSNGDLNHVYDGVKQFNVSYQKSNQRRNDEDSDNGTMHIAELHEISRFTYLVNACPPSMEASCDTPKLRVADDINPNEDRHGGMEGNHFKEASSTGPVVGNMNEVSGNDFKEEKQQFKGKSSTSGGDRESDGHISYDSCDNPKTNDDRSSPEKVFLTISDISLRTKPSRGPPPSRSPPKLAIKQGDFNSTMDGNLRSYPVEEHFWKPSTVHGTYSFRSASESSAPKEAAKGSSSCFVDFEVDASSAAAASAAAMKDAMEKAQARLKSAKLSMERKKFQNLLKPGLDNSRKGKETKETASAQENHKYTEGKVGEWRAENQFFEYFEDDTLKGFQGASQQEKKKKLNGTGKVQQHVHEEKLTKEANGLSKNGKLAASKEAILVEENDRISKGSKEAQEGKEKKLKEATADVHQQEENNEKRLKAIPQEVHLLEVSEKLKAVAENFESENNKKKFEAALEACELENEKKLMVTHEKVENEKKLKAARESFEQEENEKRLKAAQEAREREENEKRLKAAREAREREENEKRLRAALEACEREESERRLKAAQKAREREESERRLKAAQEAHEREENEKRLRAAQEAREREERERSLKAAQEAREREESERRLKAAQEAREQEESERRLKAAQEAREREESERRLKAAQEAREQEERERSLKAAQEAREREESERRLKAAQEAREQEESERRLKAAQQAREREESERRLKAAQEAREREESERRLKAALEAREREENERRLKAEQEAREREENERRLKAAEEASGREENEKRLRASLEGDRKLKAAAQVACAWEENERCKKAVEAESHDREENEKRSNVSLEAFENEKIDKRLKTTPVAQEHEKNEILSGASQMAQKHEKNEERPKAAQAPEWEENQVRSMGAEDSHDQDEFFKRQNAAEEVHEHEENERKLKEACELSENKLKATTEAYEWKETGKKLKAKQEAYECEENLENVISCSDCPEWEETGHRGYELEHDEKLKAALANQLEENEEEVGDRESGLEKELKAAPEGCHQNGKQKSFKAVQEAHEREEVRNKAAPEAQHCTSEKKEAQHCEEEMRWKAVKADENHREKKINGKASEQVINEQDEESKQLKTIKDTSRDEQHAKEVKAAEVGSSGGGKMKLKACDMLSEQDEKMKSKAEVNDGEHMKELKSAHEPFDATKMEGAQQADVLEGKEDTLRTVSVRIENRVTARKQQSATDIHESEVKSKEERRRREVEMERARRLEEERDREREREKDRILVERATREARDRAFLGARDRAERAAVERATAEARQRAFVEAREKADKASVEAREKQLAEKAAVEARLRAERAAVERATAEARERAIEKALAEKAALGTKRDERYSGNESSSGTSQRYSNSSNQASYTNGKHQGAEVESAKRCQARLERHQRTAERAAKALAEKNLRDILAQREQAERNRLSENLDAEVKRWSNGKEGNLRALLSTLQYILGPDSGWQPIPLTEVITAAAVKKAYRKATLCVHPDKVQQRGASIQQKYICEKVFDLLKEAWNKFNSEER